MRPISPQVMVLFDADNVNAEVIEQALRLVLERHGAAHVRRAYCTAELAVKQVKLFKALSIRPMVNVSTGKNSTDIALAVDAMSLVATERPDVVVLVSSDSDFAPLVIRLREHGCRVEGIGQQGKTGEESKPVYDDFVDLPHDGRARAAVAKTPAAKAAPATAPAAGKRAPAARGSRSTRSSSASRGKAADADAGVARPAPAAPPPARAPAPATSGRSRSGANTSTTPSEDERLLEALPELREGQRLQLNQAKERLHAAGLLARSAPSTKLFRKYPELFVLTPERTPNKVQYLPAGQP